MVYGSIAISLNNYENHRTETEYEDALIAKTFVFQFINSFSPMFYIAFVKPFIPEFDACLGSCMQELQTSLGTIFMTRLAMGSITGVALPYYNNRARIQQNLEGTNVSIDDMSEVEKGFLMVRTARSSACCVWAEDRARCVGGVPCDAWTVHGLREHLDPVRVHDDVRGRVPPRHLHRLHQQLHR